MAKNDNFFKQKEIELQEKLNQLKKEQAEIEKKLSAQSRINGPTQQKYVERAEKIKKIETERSFLAKEIAKENEIFKKSWLNAGCTLAYMGFNLLTLSVIPNFAILLV